MSQTKAPLGRTDETEPRTDWARLGAMTDEDIHRAIEADPEAPPIWTREDFAKAKLVMPSDRRAKRAAASAKR